MIEVFRAAEIDEVLLLLIPPTGESVKAVKAGESRGVDTIYEVTTPIKVAENSGDYENNVLDNLMDTADSTAKSR